MNQEFTPTSVPKKLRKLRDQEILNIIDKTSEALTTLCAKKDRGENTQTKRKENSFTEGVEGIHYCQRLLAHPCSVNAS